MEGTSTEHHLAPWMIESAYRYLTAAQHLSRGYDMLGVAQVNAAIGIEILLKSFISKPNGNHGLANETYKLDQAAIKKSHQLLQAQGKVAKGSRIDRHDLLTLFHAVPEPLRRRIRLDRHEQCLHHYRNVFTTARYPYEQTSPKGYDDILISILAELVVNVVQWYRDQGSKDIFIVCHGMQPKR